jgi:hypothetical protein
MYLEILEKAVADYLSPANSATVKEIIIKLTPFLYKTLQLEINSIVKLNTLVPIEELGIMSIKLHKRTITIEKSNTLDGKFELYMVEKMMKYNNTKTETNET